MVTNNALELVNDTFFLGDPMLGSKLFIRPCYKEISEIILDGASSGALRNIVATGTPGIGKTVFGFVSAVPASLPRENGCVRTEGLLVPVQ